MGVTDVAVPTVEGDIANSVLHGVGNQSSPNQQPALGPVFDTARCEEPLSPFDHDLQTAVYGSHSQLDGEIYVPDCPTIFTDRYLYPTLTQNECTRLTMLWYYTRALREDQELLQRLHQMLGLIKQSLGWEITIIGMLDSRSFSRLVTQNIPLATLPRRESTCSHTVNQHPGTVFAVTDMSQDWRFKHSPHVEFGGLRSYAGTQIRLKLQNGEDVVFGSVCVASMSVQEPLTDDQKIALIRTANLIAGELVMRNRLGRLRRRQEMVTAITQIQAEQEETGVESEVLRALRQLYPSAHVSLQEVHNDTIHVEGREPVPLSSLESGLWEDADLIMSILKQPGLDEPDIIDQPVRAIVGQTTIHGRRLIVSSNEMKLVFDDLDSWFVDQCAQAVKSVSQACALKNALAAKEKFLRSMTHELRTPIHGILSSVELLSEELKARNSRETLNSGPSSIAVVSQERHHALQPLLQAIQSSGNELMIVVNSILRMNTLTKSQTVPCPADYDLRCIESDVLSEIFVRDFASDSGGLSVRFETDFEDNLASIMVDADLLKELLKCLVLNAIAATKVGSIEVLVSIQTADALVRFDVVDSGTGIHETDRDRIFLAFEKLNIHSQGAGLGLSLASQMAVVLGGQLSLVSSQWGKGSHFRLDIPHVPAVANLGVPVQLRTSPTLQLPSKFCVIIRSSRNMHLLSHLERELLRRGMTKSTVAQDSLIITNQPNPLQDNVDNAFRTISGPHAVVVVADRVNEAFKQCVCDEMSPNLGFPIAGPLFASRLDELLSDLDHSFSKHRESSFVQQKSQSSKPISNNTSVQTADEPSTPSATLKADNDMPLLSVIRSRPTKALLVDDNKVNLRILEIFCKKRNIPYKTAENGHQALSVYCAAVPKIYDNMTVAAYSAAFTLILMDLQMPECDGVEAVKRIRQYERERQLQPSTILMITGQDSVADRKNSFEAGVDDFYVKPMSLKKLEQAITPTQLPN